MSNNDLNEFSFRNNSGTAQYSLDNGNTWVNFKNPVGTLNINTNGTNIDVTDYASVNVGVSKSFSGGQFLGSKSGTSISLANDDSVYFVHVYNTTQGAFIANNPRRILFSNISVSPTISLSGNTLSLPSPYTYNVFRLY